MSHQEIHTERSYLNDFHRKWNEACMKENERVKSMHFSHEYAKAQSERLAEIALLSDDELLKRRMQHSKDGQ